MAERASTAQSVVARVEAGITDPSSETLNRLVAAAGFAIRCELVLEPILHSHMMDDVERILSLTPEERLDEVRNVSRFETGVRRV